MDIPSSWEDVLEELIGTLLLERGIPFDRDVNPEGIARLRKLFVAMLYSDIQIELARSIERLVQERMESLTDFQIILGMHDRDFDLVDLPRLIEAVDPTAPPSTE